MNSHHHLRPIAEQVSAVQSNRVTVKELSQQVRDSINRYESRLQAWVELSELTAEGSPTDGALAGVSIGVKDIIDVQGLPTRAGSTLLGDSPREEDASCVKKFRDLGAVIQGKTVTTEFGYFSPGKTTNPFSQQHTPGGSSSGSASAVGAATIPLALGTQTAGSLTRPASYCGAAGFVFPAGSVDMTGVSGLSHTLDSLGILTHSVADLEYVWRAFTDAGSAEDSTTLATKATPTVHLWDGSRVLPIEPAMMSLLEALPKILSDIGVTSVALRYDDHIGSLTEDHRTVMAREAAETLDPLVDGRETEISTQLRELVQNGHKVSQEAYGEALVRTRNSLSALTRLLNKNGVIIGPAASGPAPKGLSATGSPDLSRAWQLLGLPALTVPGARTVTGLPLGLQIIGLRGMEPAMFTLGKKLEAKLRQEPSHSNNPETSTFKDF